VYIPNPNNVGIGTLNGISLLNTAFDPTNFVTNDSYGLAPQNTTLTVTYLVGGGAASNVQVNQLTNIVTSTSVFEGTPSNPTLQANALSSLAVNNEERAVGGGDGDSPEQLRLNTLNQFPTQMRAVTQQDYLGITLGMPPKFGQVAKAYVTKDEATFAQYLVNEPGERDPLATALYLLSYNTFGQFGVPGPALLRNVQTYLKEYRMLTDTIRLKPAYIITRLIENIPNCIKYLQGYTISEQIKIVNKLFECFSDDLTIAFSLLETRKIEPDIEFDEQTKLLLELSVRINIVNNNYNINKILGITQINGYNDANLPF
jgi:hypothetical protein